MGLLEPVLVDDALVAVVVDDGDEVALFHLLEVGLEEGFDEGGGGGGEDEKMMEIVVDSVDVLEVPPQQQSLLEIVAHLEVVLFLAPHVLFNYYNPPTAPPKGTSAFPFPHLSNLPSCSAHPFSSVLTPLLSVFRWSLPRFCSYEES